jgi:hypothetical protein
VNEKKEIKVTDKRMFTPDGELREEYRVLAEKSTAPTGGTATVTEPAPVTRPAPEPPQPVASAPMDLPEMPPDLDGGPSFFDLVAMLAEPVPIYLGDAVLPDGQDATNLEMARFYIDLLGVLRQKSAGNLTAQESAFLDDLLYRMRVRYVQKGG